MSRLKIKGINPSSVPVPATGYATLFLNSINGKYSILKDSGDLVNLENDGGSGSDYDPTTPADWDDIAADLPINTTEGLDDIAATLNAILPAKALALGLLVISNTSLFNGKLPSGLNSLWYSGGNNPGDIITTLIYDNSFNLTFLGFRAGKFGIPSSYGQISTKVNGSITDTYDMTGGAGSNGTVAALNFLQFNTLWNKADGVLTIVQTSEGFKAYKISHTEAGDSNIYSIFYDNNVAAPSFSVAASVTLLSKVSKWLSGIEYFGYGSQFRVTYTILNLFNKVYKPTGASTAVLTGLITKNIDPGSVPAYTDPFVVVNNTLTLDDPNQSNLNPTLVINANKPNSNGAASSSVNIKTALSLAIDTYGTVSTTANELFHDEAQRLIQGTNTTFVSNVALAAGEAQVRSGTLTYGNVDYTKTGDQRYDRRFIKAIANSGSIIFNGLSISNISPYGTGDINILLWLETDNKYFDLGKLFGSNNGSGSGTSLANSLGGKVSGSGSNLSFTFGTFTTANNSDRYRMIIIFRNSNQSITSIITS